MGASFADYLRDSSLVMLAAGAAIRQDLLNSAVETIGTALAGGKPLLVCGNGGSASDAMHITTELVGQFLCQRPPCKVICLCENPAFLTAWSNDCGYETAFARQVEAYGEDGAVLLGISTSGQSKSVIAAFQQAQRMKMTTIALTGADGGQLGPLADFLLAVPSRSTPLVQQVHVCVYHYLCQAIEDRLMRQRREPSVAVQE